MSASDCRCLGANSATVSTVSSYTPAEIAPGSPAGSYVLSGFDTVNLHNLHVNFRFPLMRVGGRGAATVEVMPSFHYIWNDTVIPQPDNCGQGQSGCTFTFYDQVMYTEWEPVPAIDGVSRMVARGSGFSCNSATLQSGTEFWSQALTRLTLTTSDGTETEFVDQNTGGNPQTGRIVSRTSYDRGSVFVARDGSQAVFTLAAATPVTDPQGCNTYNFGVSGTLVTSDGTAETFTNGYTSQIRDRNGNLTTFAYPGNGSTGGVVITDSIGRVYTVTPGTDPGSQRNYVDYQYPRTGGGSPISIRIWYDWLHNVLKPGVSLQYLQQLWPNTKLCAQANTVCSPQSGGLNDENHLVARIDLPDGSFYQFFYDSYGSVARLILPTGGMVEYDYFSGSGRQTPSSPTIMTHKLTTRREYLHSSDSTPSAIITYSGGSGVTTVSRFDGNNNLISKEVHTFGAAGDGSAGGNGNNAAFFYDPWGKSEESQIDRYASDGTTILQTEQEQWMQRDCNTDPNCWFGDAQGGFAPSHDPRLVADTVSQNGSVRKTTYQYDQYNNVADRYDYDYGSGAPGSLLRHTVTTYVAGQYTNSNIGLLRLPFETRILEGNGQQRSYTVRHYDEVDANHQVADSPGIVQHDSAYASSANNNIRGNLTSILRSTDGSNTVDNLTIYNFDIAGNVVRTMNPNGHWTQYGFDSSNQFSAPTSITPPTPGTSGISQQVTISYDPSSDKPVSTRNANGVISSYTYNDPLDRLTEAAKAGVHTLYQYPDVNTVVRYQDQDSTHTGAQGLQTRTIYDGFGRISETQTREDSSHYIAVDTTYNALGLVGAVSNPYRPGDRVLWTSTIPDALGRTAQVQQPDGTVVQTLYTGNTTTVADEASLKKTYTYDGLSRLVNVIEDPAGQNLATSYVYDALGDLTSVTQGTCSNCQQRSFTYDGLGRLATARNPETGLSSYVYDAAGNLKAKTNARNVTLSYSYDELERVLQKSASDSTVSYTYDTSALGVGLPATVSASTGNIVTLNSFSSYDSFGRITGNSQVVNGMPYPFSYSYNFAGALVSETYPSGRTVTTSYDAANRPVQVDGTLQNQIKNYVNAVAYAAHGALQSYSYGNGLARTYQYNARLQPSIINDSTASLNPAFQLQLFWGDNATQTTNNNGNLRGQLIESTMPSSFNAYYQTFSYDALNRLAAFTDNGSAPPSPGYWQRSFAYDRYGNMSVSSNDSGLPLNPATPASASSFDPNTNHLVGVPYDAAGNQSVVGSGALAETLTYDAENRVSTATTNGVPTTYTYDGQDNRVAKSTVNGSTIVYVYDAFNQLAAEYSTAPSSSSCQTCYLSWDHLGSTRMVTDQNAQVVSRHDYLPFGDELTSGYAGRPNPWGGNENVNQKFTGKERDSESGLDYFGARYYGSALGRFTSPDWSEGAIPIPYADLHNPQSLNLYTYVQNNPLSVADPDGHSCKSDAGGETGKWLACNGVVGDIAGYTVNAVKDTLVAAGKGVSNLAIGVTNATNNAANAGLSLTDTKFRFITYNEFQADTPGERSGMYAMSVLGMFTTGGESAEIELLSSIGKDKGLIRLAEEAGASVQTGIDSLTSQLAKGNLNPGIGTKNLFGNISYARARDGARVFFRVVGDKVEILAKANKSNESPSHKQTPTALQVGTYEVSRNYLCVCVCRRES